MSKRKRFRSSSSDNGNDVSEPITARIRTANTIVQQESPKSKPQIFITGLGTCYPPHSLSAQDFDDYVRKTCDVDNRPSLQKLLSMKTQIQTRHLVIPITSPFFHSKPPPTLAEINSLFATHSLTLTLTACRAALADACLSPSQITHTVAVTSTNFALPGYDFAVAQAFGFSSGIERMLLAGVGCAGGMSALRSALNLSLSASARGKAARILVMACEICSLNIRAALQETVGEGGAGSLNITSVLFGDGAGAVVVCNELALAESGKREEKYEVLDWGCEVLEGTMEDMNMTVETEGYRAYMSKSVPTHAINSILPMLTLLIPSPKLVDYDWAIHPGGISILKDAEKNLGITEQHMRASYDVYRKRGNTAASTILSVLDTLRKKEMGEGRERVVACAFGPGMIVEMAVMRRC